MLLALVLQPAMESWEYLIQKEGDRAWLPLELDSAELEEGRYRVVARAGRPHTEVEVRLMYESVGEVPPQQRVHKRIRHTNKDGLMVVFPYTDLKPGIWEISCSGDLMSDLLGNGWKYTVRLQVLPIGSEAYLELKDDSSTLETEDTHAEETTEISQLHIGDNLLNLAEQDKSVPESPADASVESDSAADPRHCMQLSLTLDREVCAAREDRSVTVSGRVAQAQANSQQRDAQVIEAQVKTYELEISLREPQNSQVLLSLRRSLWVRVLPMPFECAFELPSDCQTRLILGDVKLFEIAPAPGNPSTALATADFKITIGINELIEKIARQHYRQKFANPWEKITPFPGTGIFTETDGKLESAVESDPQTQPPQSSINLVFFNLAKQPKERHRLDFQPAANGPLPPQIAQSHLEKPLSKPPQLPLFGAKEEQESNNGAILLYPADGPRQRRRFANANSTEALEREPADTSRDENPKPRKPIGLPPIEREKAEMVEDLVSDENASQVSPLDGGFRLKIQERFSQRLQDLAKRSESSEPLATAEEDSITSEDMQATIFTERLELEESVDAGEDETKVEDSARTEREDVADIDEEMGVILPDVEENLEEVAEVKSDVELSRWERGHLLHQFDESDEPVPMPELDVPGGDFVAGKAIALRVKLPDFSSRLFVKLWVIDRQTRALLGGPHWLVDFEPHISGGVQAQAQLTVPPGCMEVQIEAIAVEVKSQRESRKLTINRTIVPPDLPNLSLDEFDLS